jgi:hypothetical protein
MHVFFVYNIFFLIACFVNSSPEVTFRIALILIRVHVWPDNARVRLKRIA